MTSPFTCRCSGGWNSWAAVQRRHQRLRLSSWSEEKSSFPPRIAKSRENCKTSRLVIWRSAPQPHLTPHCPGLVPEVGRCRPGGGDDRKAITRDLCWPAFSGRGKNPRTIRAGEIFSSVARSAARRGGRDWKRSEIEKKALQDWGLGSPRPRRERLPKTGSLKTSPRQSWSSTDVSPAHPRPPLFWPTSPRQ